MASPDAFLGFDLNLVYASMIASRAFNQLFSLQCKRCNSSIDSRGATGILRRKYQWDRWRKMTNVECRDEAKAAEQGSVRYAKMVEA